MSSSLLNLLSNAEGASSAAAADPLDSLTGLPSLPGAGSGSKAKNTSTSFLSTYMDVSIHNKPVAAPFFGCEFVNLGSLSIFKFWKSGQKTSCLLSKTAIF